MTRRNGSVWHDHLPHVGAGSDESLDRRALRVFRLVAFWLFSDQQATAYEQEDTKQFEWTVSIRLAIRRLSVLDDKRDGDGPTDEHQQDSAGLLQQGLPL